MSATPDPSATPAHGLLLGRACPHCGLASRLTAAEGGLGATCLKCGGLFVGDEVLTRLAGARRVFPPTLPIFECSRLCPVCEVELADVLAAGLAANVCEHGHGAFFDRARAALVTRMLADGAPDVVAAGHVTRSTPPRPGASAAVTPLTALAVVAALLALAYKLGA